MNRAVHLASVALVTILGFTLLSWATGGWQVWTAESARREAIAKHPIALGAFSLQQENGRTISLDGFNGRLVLAEFMFTRCTTVCPTMGYTLGRLQRRLAAEGFGDEVQFVSISFDRVHDRPRELLAYRNRFANPESNWSVVRPTHQQALEQLLDTLGVVVIPDEVNGYIHNSAVYFIEDNKVISIADYDDPRLFDRVVEKLRDDQTS